MDEKARSECLAARKAGCIFYSMPWDLGPLDPLIAPVVHRINESGWVWTAESCQGHPDAEEGGVWASNTRPMLRLVTRKENVGRLYSFLHAAYQELCEGVRASLLTDSPRIWEVGAIELYPAWNPVPGGDWSAVLVYLGAATAYQRNQGIRVFEEFAKKVSPE